MSLIKKTDELRRLISSFESESARFHPLTLTTFFVTQQGESPSRPFATPNHAIMLWQYYGVVKTDQDPERLAVNIMDSELKWGLRGADLSCFAILEGQGYELFVRMAQRAGSLFDEVEARVIKSNIVEELIATEQARQPSAKPVAVSNDNPLAIWINYLLYHLSLTNPGRERAQKIEPDPFSLSLLALERLRAERVIGKIDRSIRLLSEIKFQVAMSFPGEHRPYVASAVEKLRQRLGPDAVFYDLDYQAQLARPNLDVLLQDIYRNRSLLVVVFLCEKYAEKQWCGLEWRAIRDMIKSKQDDQIMFVRFDDATVDGVLSIDGYIDARRYSPKDVADFVLTRLNELGHRHE
jgi:TIR domain